MDLMNTVKKKSNEVQNLFKNRMLSISDGSGLLGKDSDIISKTS